MKRFTLLTLLFSTVLQFNYLTAQELPQLKHEGNINRLYVDGKPFIMVAGELHNSTSSNLTYLVPIFPKLKEMGLNTVLASIAWEQFEPQEGKFDYSIIDGIISQAHQNKLKLCLLWFGSWKNGLSTYPPLWVKKDSKRFFKLKQSNGNTGEVISPFCKEAQMADAKAFVQLMKRIKEVDKEHTVIMIQAENEVGAFQDIDYNKEALDLFHSQVPETLIRYLQKNTNNLSPEIKYVWQKNGSKTKGTWSEIFADTMKSAQNFFMTWQYAKYINEICRSGKKELNLPMYVNAWLVQKNTDLPGVYPNGGPVSRVIDIYKAIAPDIDLCAPDIYAPNYKEVLSMYHRSDNPLFIPESTTEQSRAFYAYAEHDAICFSPFGIEDAYTNLAYRQAISVINELMPYLIKYQGTGKMRGFMRTKNIKADTLVFGGDKVIVEYNDWDNTGYGLVIQTAPDEYIVAGITARLKFESKDPSKKMRIGQVFEGKFEGEQWVTTRMLNGDETWHHDCLLITGRKMMISQTLEGQIVPPQPGPSQPVLESTKNTEVQTPAVYKVTTYEMK
jgi:beta-galactosidase GanA